MGTTAARTTQRRYWRRTDKPTSGWWPGGFLPLLALVLLFGVGAIVIAPGIEAQVQAEVTDSYERAGFTPLDVSANGQEINARLPGTEADRAVLEALAGDSRCDTWAGRLRCPNTVTVRLAPEVAEVPEVSEVAEVSEVSEAPSPTSAETSPQAAPPLSFQLTRLEGRLTLAGEQPSLPDSGAIEAVLAEHAEGFEIVSSAVESPDAALYLAALRRAAAVLSHLEQGEANWRNGTLSVSGLASDDARSDAESAFYASGFPSLGTLTLRTAQSAPQCDARFAAALAGANIEFRTASAAIDPASQPLLIEIASVAADCPGILMVEGHTDNTGSAEINASLSQNRADAVAQALAELGVERRRLRTQGLGSAAPVADNSTADGRARNRRIVVRTDTSDSLLQGAES